MLHRCTLIRVFAECSHYTNMLGVLLTMLRLQLYIDLNCFEKSIFNYRNIQIRLIRICVVVHSAFKVNEYISMFFSAIFAKGSNFCYFTFASLEGKAHQKWDQLLKERIYSLEANSFN